MQRLLRNTISLPGTSYFTGRILIPLFIITYFIFSGHIFLWPFVFHINLCLLFLFAVGSLHIQVEYFNFILLVDAYHYAGDPLYIPVCLQIMSMPVQLEPYKD